MIIINYKILKPRLSLRYKMNILFSIEKYIRNKLEVLKGRWSNKFSIHTLKVTYYLVSDYIF